MTVDARGYSCPMPVVMVQKAVKADVPATLEVLVDNQCSVENVTASKLINTCRLTLYTVPAVQEPVL